MQKIKYINFGETYDTRRIKMKSLIKYTVYFVQLCLYLICLIKIVQLILDYNCLDTAHYQPDYEQLDLSPILAKETLLSKDYTILFYQTGLGKLGIDSIWNTEDSSIIIEEIQSDFFKEIPITCRATTPFTHEDTIDSSLLESSFMPVENGDILITLSPHAYGWKNGHAALVIDAKKGITLECIMIGTNSSYQKLSTWSNYSNYAILRYKDISPSLQETIITYAKESLHNIPYNLTVGITNKKESTPSLIGTHCSHLVWSAFYHFHIDLDSDGGKIVTPYDILHSPELEIVRIYGMMPMDFISSSACNLNASI